MLFQTAQKFLSAARLSPYLQAARGNQQEALTLYTDNLQIAQSFYTPLAYLEIALRNALDDVLSHFFHSPDWLISEQNGFMVSSALHYFDVKNNRQVDNDKVLNMVRAAISEVAKRTKRAPTKGAEIMAELHFGFWTTLFTQDYATVLLGRPVLAFAHKPTWEDNKSINSKLFTVRMFRNRVYHYESLCLQQSTSKQLNFRQIEKMHKLIFDLISWLDPDLATWLATVDRLPKLLAQLRTQYPHAR